MLDEALHRAVEAAAAMGVRKALTETVMDGTGPLLYSPAAAADVLGCSERSVYDLLNTGQLTAVDGPGRGRQIARRDLVAYVDRLLARTAGLRGAA